ncbi:MAG: succinyl-diaminopimelate desuccinylase [Acidimicrobiales bacterium]
MSTDLLARTAELVQAASVSRQERSLADQVAGELGRCPGLALDRLGDNVVARTRLGRSHRLVVAGHLDTVPPAGNAEPRIDGDVLWGLGAADMKGGLAVMLDLAASPVAPAVDVTWCFYAREEVARSESGLLQLWEERPDLLAADAAVLGEPTGALVEAGCQGTMRAVVHLAGVRAHTARPFTGRNAIHRLVPVLDRVAAWEGRRVTLDGCEYVEQLQAVGVEGGIAPNVVPDQAKVTLNYRYAPDRDGAAARAFLSDLLESFLEPERGDRWEVVDAADGAPPSLDHPLLAALVRGAGAPPRAKVGWTDVATFWAHGVPAANFGPGDPLLAHHPDERVERRSLERAREVLAAVLAAAPAA